MPRTSHLIALGTIALLAGCKPKPVDESAAAAAAIKAADSAWEKAMSSRDTNAAVAMVDSTGSVLSSNAPIATGHQAVRALFEGFYAIPNLNLHWQASQTGAARSGELGYSTGTYEMNFNDPKGNPLSDHGKYATVWRKQADGSWKVLLDVFNSDVPIAGP